MKHLFVPYDIAFMAKEKGFNESCFGGYEQDGKEFRYYIPNDYLKIEIGIQHKEHTFHTNDNLIDAHCTAPLYQQLIDWFAETHNIQVMANVHFASVQKTEYHPFVFQKIKTEYGWDWSEDLFYNKPKKYSKHEAYNVALKKAFKLI